MQELHPDWFDFEWLPTYSPELNPVEQCWNHTKYADLANFLAEDTDDLLEAIECAIYEQQKKPGLIQSFFRFAKLSL